MKRIDNILFRIYNKPGRHFFYIVMGLFISGSLLLLFGTSVAHHLIYLEQGPRPMGMGQALEMSAYNMALSGAQSGCSVRPAGIYTWMVLCIQQFFAACLYLYYPVFLARITGRPGLNDLGYSATSAEFMRRELRTFGKLVLWAALIWLGAAYCVFSLNKAPVSANIISEPRWLAGLFISLNAMTGAGFVHLPDGDFSAYSNQPVFLLMLVVLSCLGMLSYPALYDLLSGKRLRARMLSGGGWRSYTSWQMGRVALVLLVIGGCYSVANAVGMKRLVIGAVCEGLFQAVGSVFTGWSSDNFQTGSAGTLNFAFLFAGFLLHFFLLPVGGFASVYRYPLFSLFLRKKRFPPARVLRWIFLAWVICGAMISLPLILVEALFGNDTFLNAAVNTIGIFSGTQFLAAPPGAAPWLMALGVLIFRLSFVLVAYKAYQWLVLAKNNDQPDNLHAG